MANLLVPMGANQDVRAEFFNTSIDNMRSVAYQTADITINNQAATFQAAQDLVIPGLVANAEYIFESCLFYDTSASADIYIRLHFPFIANCLVAPWSSGTAITGATNSINQQANVDGTSSDTIEFAAGGVASGTVMSIRPVGWIRMSNASGSLTVEFTQNTAAAVNTILKQGSWIALTRVL